MFEGLWTSNRNSSNCTKIVQLAPLAPFAVRNTKETLPGENLSTSAKPHQRKYALLSNFGLVEKETKKLYKCSVSPAEPLEFPSQVSDIARTAKQKYKLRISHGSSTVVLHIAARFLDDGAWFNLFFFFMNINNLKDRIKWKNSIALNDYETIAIARRTDPAAPSPWKLMNPNLVWHSPAFGCWYSHRYHIHRPSHKRNLSDRTKSCTTVFQPNHNT